MGVPKDPRSTPSYAFRYDQDFIAATSGTPARSARLDSLLSFSLMRPSPLAGCLLTPGVLRCILGYTGCNKNTEASYPQGTPNVKGRPMAKSRKPAKRDPQVPIDGQRLREILRAEGIGAKTMADRLRQSGAPVSHVTLVKIMTGQQSTTRTSIRAATAKVFDDISENFLAGEGLEMDWQAILSRRVANRRWDWWRGPDGPANYERFFKRTDAAHKRAADVLDLENWLKLMGDPRATATEEQRAAFGAALFKALRLVFEHDVKRTKTDREPRHLNSRGLDALAHLLAGGNDGQA